MGRLDDRGGLCPQRCTQSACRAVLDHEARPAPNEAAQDNPCEITELPKDNRWAKRQVRFLLHEEWATLRGCLDPDVWLLVDTLLATGMRWGEATAVQVGDVHFAEDGTAQVHVQRAWKRRMADEKLPPNTAEFETSHTKLGLPTSKRGRWVMVQGDLATRLYDHVGGMNPQQFLFMTPGRSTKGMGPVPWRHELFAKSRWRPAVARAALLGMQRHATPHMLRHTAVVWSLADGVPIEVISEMLGHASIQVTQDVYGGLLDVKDPRMAQAMARALLDVTGRRALSVVS